MIDWFAIRQSLTESRDYIEMNLVRPGMVVTPEEFPWSSAWPIDNRPQIDNLPHMVRRA